MKEIDKDVKNKFRWSWLKKKCNRASENWEKHGRCQKSCLITSPKLMCQGKRSVYTVTILLTTDRLFIIRLVFECKNLLPPKVRHWQRDHCIQKIKAERQCEEKCGRGGCDEQS